MEEFEPYQPTKFDLLMADDGEEITPPKGWVPRLVPAFVAPILLAGTDIARDFFMNFRARELQYTGDGSCNYTINELYSYLGDLTDMPANMQEPVVMVAQDRYVYSVCSEYTIDDEVAKYLRDGCLLQRTGAGYGEAITLYISPGSISYAEMIQDRS